MLLRRGLTKLDRRTRVKANLYHIIMRTTLLWRSCWLTSWSAHRVLCHQFGDRWNKCFQSPNTRVLPKASRTRAAEWCFKVVSLSGKRLLRIGWFIVHSLDIFEWLRLQLNMPHTQPLAFATHWTSFCCELGCPCNSRAVQKTKDNGSAWLPHSE
jgi:hypothetical protein